METGHPLILFDGICNFCNSGVNFLLRQDKKDIFRFASLQSESGKKILTEHHLPLENFDSFILVDEGKVYKKSTAFLKVFNRLPWYWKGMQGLRILPRLFRDRIYDLIATHRYKWFGKKDECMVPTAEVRSRFL